MNPVLVETEELVLETGDVFLLNAYSCLGNSTPDLRYRHYHDLARYPSVFRCNVDRKQRRSSQLLRLHLLSIDRDLEGSVSSKRKNVGPGQQSSPDICRIRFLDE